MADLRGGHQGRLPSSPGGPNSLIFMQFSAEKIGQHTHLGSWRRPPPPGDPILTVSKTYCRQDLVCHNNKDGRVQRILGNSYGQPIIGDMWKSVAPYHFCNRDHKHPEYGRVLTGDSNGEFTD